jgi:hypothetical protein
MTQIETHKAVAYALEQPELRAAAHKAVAYVVEQPPGSLEAHKAVAYVVEQVPNGQSAHKAVAYAVEQVDASGNAYQDDSALRPRYRDGSIPRVDFIGGTRFLNYSAVFGGDYQAIRYNADDTFDDLTLPLVSGPNELPRVDFNQLVLVQGRPLSRIAVRSIKLTMRARVVPTDLGTRPIELVALGLVTGAPTLGRPGAVQVQNATLLSGDMTDGDDRLKLSGDMTDGDDVELQSGV